MRFPALASLLLLATCTAPRALPPAPVVDLSDEASSWSFEGAAAGIASQSCAEAAGPAAPLSLAINAAPVEFGPAAEAAKRLPEGVTFAGGWHLTSDNETFGGLSGLAVDGGDGLLAVVDNGAFVRIGVSGGVPDGTGALTYMLGADGNQLSGKTLGDSEGLAIRYGLAVVSFERTHRVSAFALDTCGAAAREVVLADLPNSFNGRAIDENRGAEALSVTPEGDILFGFETTDGGDSPMGAVAGMDQAGWTGDMAPNPSGYAFVGLDTVKLGKLEETFWLFRSYDPIRGNRNVIKWDGEEIVITRPMTTDNFEGIAVDAHADGSARVWIVSDDNFSPMQRTLLLAFDIAAPSE